MQGAILRRFGEMQAARCPLIRRKQSAARKDSAQSLPLSFWCFTVSSRSLPRGGLGKGLERVERLRSSWSVPNQSNATCRTVSSSVVRLDDGLESVCNVKIRSLF